MGGGLCKDTRHDDSFNILLPVSVYDPLIMYFSLGVLPCPRLSLVFFKLFCLVTPLACSLHQCPCNLIHAAYLSHSVFFHILTNMCMLLPQKQLEQWKSLPKRPFKQHLRGWLESFNSNKAERKECLLLVIPHLLDKASQGSSAVLNWCTYSYLFRSSL